MTATIAAPPAGSLADLRLTLVAERGATFNRCPARAVHAALHRALEGVDRSLAYHIHGGATNPFALSPLFHVYSNAPVRKTLARGERVWARITTLDEPIRAGLRAALGGVGDQRPILMLEWQPFQLVGISEMSEASGTFAGPVNYARLLREAEPAREITLRFTSPTVFRNKGRDLLAPEPRLVFGSFLRRWETYSPVALPSLADGAVERRIALADAQLTVESRNLGYVEQPGFVGIARYRVADDPTLGKVAATLAAFAEYCGTGARTAYGMGQTERVPL